MNSMGGGHVDTAKRDEDGKRIANKDIRFPFYLRFVPNRDALPKTELSTETPWFDQLTGSNIPVGTKMFDVYATWMPPCTGKGCKADKDPHSRPLSEMTKIGEITSTSEFTTSLWGDERLFFRLNRMHDEFYPNKGGDSSLNPTFHY